MNGYYNGMKIQYFNGYCYTHNGFGHKSIECRFRKERSELVQKDVICYNCNRSGHISNFCKSKNMKKINLVKKNDLVKKIDLVEMKKEMNKI